MGTISLVVVGDQVEVRFALSGKTSTAVLSAAEARLLAQHLGAAANVADAGGAPHGHA